MNFTNSPYEKMMKEIPRPGRSGADRCAGMPLLKRVAATEKTVAARSFAPRAKLARSSDVPGTDP